MSYYLKRKRIRTIKITVAVAMLTLLIFAGFFRFTVSAGNAQAPAASYSNSSVETDAPAAVVHNADKVPEVSGDIGNMVGIQ